MMNIISLGAGVQSSTMALMGATGELDYKIDSAIFADTQWEPEPVYKHLDWLETQLPFPVYRVSFGNIREIALATTDSKIQKNWSPTMPIFIDSDSEKGGMGIRQCTKNFKIEPIEKKIRNLLGLKKGQRMAVGTQVETWIGISKDCLLYTSPSPRD